MKAGIPKVALLCGLLVAFVGCDPVGSDPAVISGTVLHSQTEEPIVGAHVALLNVGTSSTVQETTTDEEGRFSFAIDIEEATTFRVIATRSGFEPAERTVSVEAEQVLTLASPFVLVPLGEGNGNGNGGGTVIQDPHSITLEDRTSQAIGVSGSGSVETATLTFVVLDGNGEPLNAASSVVVQFELLNQPSVPGSPGAEFIFPSEAATDADGLAKVTLTSGTISGPVQIRARVETDDGFIHSTPVVVTIHGGLPDSVHFTVAPVQRNFHGRTIYGIENVITAIAGDQYGNPVQPGTEIYFTTTHGLVGGSGSTDQNGRTTSILQSAEPLPNVDGIGTVTGRTVGIDGQTVEATTQVLFSGETQVELIFEGGELSAGGEHYTYHVTDDLGNPIVGGSTVSVNIQGEQVTAFGDLSMTIPDALAGGEGITDFAFVVRKSSPDASDASLDEITIQVNSPNGNRTYSFVMRFAPGIGTVAPADVIAH